MWRGAPPICSLGELATTLGELVRQFGLEAGGRGQKAIESLRVVHFLSFILFSKASSKDIRGHHDSFSEASGASEGIREHQVAPTPGFEAENDMCDAQAPESGAPPKQSNRSDVYVFVDDIMFEGIM